MSYGALVVGPPRLRPQACLSRRGARARMCRVSCQVREAGVQWAATFSAVPAITFRPHVFPLSLPAVFPGQQLVIIVGRPGVTPFNGGPASGAGSVQQGGGGGGGGTWPVGRGGGGGGRSEIQCATAVLPNTPFPCVVAGGGGGGSATTTVTTPVTGCTIAAAAGGAAAWSGISFAGGNAIKTTDADVIVAGAASCRGGGGGGSSNIIGGRAVVPANFGLSGFGGSPGVSNLGGGGGGGWFGGGGGTTGGGGGGSSYFLPDLLRAATGADGSGFVPGGQSSAAYSNSCGPGSAFGPCGAGGQVDNDGGPGRVAITPVLPPTASATASGPPPLLPNAAVDAAGIVAGVSIALFLVGIAVGATGIIVVARRRRGGASFMTSGSGAAGGFPPQTDSSALSGAIKDVAMVSPIAVRGSVNTAVPFPQGQPPLPRPPPGVPPPFQWQPLPVVNETQQPMPGWGGASSLSQ